jgi:hypothetical protein
MSSVKAVTEDIVFTAKIASFYELNSDERMELVKSISELLEEKSKKMRFLVWRVQMEQKQ